MTRLTFPLTNTCKGYSLLLCQPAFFTGGYENDGSCRVPWVRHLLRSFDDLLSGLRQVPGLRNKTGQGREPVMSRMRSAVL